MTKRLASLFLLLMLGSSVLAGMPLHSGEGKSSMMDCCKKALEQSDSPRVTAARLCCAINCNEPASTNANTGQSFSQIGSETGSLVSVAPPLVLTNNHPRASYSAPGNTSSKPAYILNLALLI